MRKTLYPENNRVLVGGGGPAEVMAVAESGGRPVKRQRRRVTAELRDFRSFPSESEQTGVFQGPFRANVKDFLSLYAWMLPPPPEVDEALPQQETWRMPLTVGSGGGGGGGGGVAEGGATTVDLEVVVEDVARATAAHCDQCRVVGWSGNPVCSKRYHFIIKNDGKAMVRPRHKCVRCGSLLDGSDMRCTTCSFEMPEEDLEGWTYQLLEDNNHLLHAVVHGNGYGHLLRVNGREGGSKILRGCDIMDFWDRLCRMLRVRKVTVMDISKKYGLEYRLLHAITTGRPWYGEWGYEFGTGSFALSAKAYEDAINTLSKLPISLFFSHSRSPRSQLQDVIAFYMSLSDQQLLTVGDIFRFILRLINETHKLVQSDDSYSARRKKHLQISCGILCAWTAEDVKAVEEACVKILRAAASGNWVTFRALRGAMCHSIESFELLDYCLKGLSGKLTSDGMVVAVRCNADTHSIEYRIEPALEGSPSFQISGRPSGDYVIRDLKFLYDALLNPHTMHPYKPDTTRALALKSSMVLLDCKRFIKSYDRSLPHDVATDSLHIWCETELIDQPKSHTVPPPELLVIPETATIALLKLAAARAFQDVYIAYQRFEVDKVVDYDGLCDSTNVKLLIGRTGSVQVKGRCPTDNRLAQYRMERGTEKWIVDCLCGVKDDDGERMVACDVCGVWSHTRCIGVNDADEVPKKLVCMRCGGRRSSSAKAFTPFRASNRRPKCINEKINRINGNRRSVQSHLANTVPIVAGENSKPIIKECNGTRDDIRGYNSLSVTSVIPDNARDGDVDMLNKEQSSSNATEGDNQVVLLANITNGKINETNKHNQSVTGIIYGGTSGFENGMDGTASSAGGKKEVIPATGDINDSDQGHSSKVSLITDATRTGNGRYDDETSDMINKDVTDRGGGRCKDMSSPIAEVGLYVTMTCK